MSVRTPFPVGAMPEGIRAWTDGPPYGRVQIDVVGIDGRGRVLDGFTGEWFVWRGGVACGTCQCKCAAEIEWVGH